MEIGECESYEERGVSHLEKTGEVRVNKPAEVRQTEDGKCRDRKGSEST